MSLKWAPTALKDSTGSFSTVGAKSSAASTSTRLR
jgi:hypothetical protein